MVASSLLLVDAASLYFRAYHGIPVTAMVTADGTPVNAVHGFVDMLATLVRTRRPGRCVCAMDADWRPEWRIDLVGSYKAHRVGVDGAEETPAPLLPQVPVMLEVLRAVGIATVGVSGFEADDVLATLAARGPGPVEVATGDRDLFQVVNDVLGVVVLDCGRGVAKLTVVDEAGVLARFGVPARWYADFATLRGDPSDGLPGVAGVGAKTAARLVSEFGGLDGILAAVEDPGSALSPRLRARLVDARDYLDRALRVVVTCAQVPVPDQDVSLRPGPADPEGLAVLAERWRVTGPVRRLLEAMAMAAADGAG